MSTPRGAGTLLAGRYRLVEPLGSGGMGTVWRGLDELLDRVVAIKEVSLPAGLDDRSEEALRRRTLREARSAARLRHTGIVTVYDVAEQDGRLWIVMELVEAPTLQQVVRDRGPLAPARAAAVGMQILDAMVTAQAAGVQHRDIKPANVMLTDAGRVVLTDFGIARHTGDESATTTGMVIGSPDFLSPERARGKDTPGLEADLWSLGATLYAAVEGRAPFRREGPLPTLHAIVTDEPDPQRLSGPLRPVIDGLLHKDPTHRLTADETRRLLQDVLRGRRPEASPPGPTRAHTVPLSPAPAAPAPPVPAERAPEPAPVQPAPASPASRAPSGGGRRRWVWVAAAVVAVVVAGIAAWLVPRDDDRTPSAGPTSAAPATDAAGAATTTAPRATTAAPAPTTAAPTTTAPTTTPTTTPAVPAGFTRYTDSRYGWSVVVPQGWRPIRRSTLVDFDDPSSSRFLRVDTSTNPQADPYTNWVTYERTFRQGRSSYRNLGIRRVTDYRPDEGWTVADWEFTLGGTHVLNRNIRVSDTRAHALYWSVPSSRWDDADTRRTFDVAAATFEPGVS